MLRWYSYFTRQAYNLSDPTVRNAASLSVKNLYGAYFSLFCCISRLS
ncbi:hypothetical protein ACHAXM_000900, partial [Skeletonema potamos]